MQRVAVPLHRDGDGAAGRRELHGVRDEVVDDLREPARVAAHGRRAVDRELERDVLLDGSRPPGFDAAPDELSDVDRLERELDTTRFDLGNQQEILDEPVQAVGAAANHFEIRASRVADPVLFVLHHLEETGDRRQRRPQLVRDGRDECVAHPVELAVGGHLA